jgi:diaminopimelate decarboxylase
MQNHDHQSVPLETLADEFGTPLYVYSMDCVQERLHTLTRAFASVPFLVAYSVKANGNLALLSRLAGTGCGADIVSGGELYRALQGGVPPSRILFAGVAKSDEEIRAALEAGIYAFNVESGDELHRLDALAAGMKVQAPFAVRINPDILAPTPHEYTRTGHATTKFGVAVPAAMELYRWAASRPHLGARGIDVHIGSQIVDPAPYVAALKTALEVVRQLETEGTVLEFVDLGGGFGIPYESDGMNIGALAQALLPVLRGRNLRLVLEPGRYLVGEAGVLLTRVRWVKRVSASQAGEEGVEAEGIRSGRGESSAAHKVFVITDAGMSDLLRPSHYGSYHPIDVVGAARAEKEIVDVVGPLCETGDFLARDRLLPLPRPGDLLAVRNVGAYGFSMASNYNGRPRPAEVMVETGRVHLIRKREEYWDLIRDESIPPPFAPIGIQDKVRHCARSEIELGTEPDSPADRPLSPTNPGE